MSRRFRRSYLVWLLLTIMAVFHGLFTTQHSLAQTSQTITNGSFELENNGLSTGWTFPGSLAKAGIEITPDKNDPLDGEKSALVDTTKKDSSDTRVLGMLNQRIDPTPFRGKRIRFRAAVRTAERSEQGRAQEIEHEHPTKIESDHPLINRGYRWINEYPFNR